MPPSEDEMATWLYPIITGGGQDHVCDDYLAGLRTDDRVITSKVSNKLLKENREEATENNMATVLICPPVLNMEKICLEFGKTTFG